MTITTTVTFDGDPPELFKYWAMPAAGSEEEGYLRDLLIGHQLFFKEAHKLNDPYDCFPAIYANVTPERARLAFTRQLKRLAPDLDDQAREVEVEKLLANFDFDAVNTREFQSGARDAFKEQREVFAVYCLSTRNDSVLMWSHYAKDHTGFAVMFDGTDPIIREAQRVRYEIDRPLIDPGAGKAETIHKTLLAKARDWKYEKEWRITRVGNPGLHAVDPAAITGIIFGMAMPEPDRERLRAICAEGGLNPKFLQAVDDARSFNVGIVDA